MTTVNTAVVELKLNTRDFDSGLSRAKGSLNSLGSVSDKGASKVSKGWSLALGAIGGVAVSAFNKVSSIISSTVDGAIKRADVLNAFPKIMKNLGINSDDAAKSIQRISDNIQGLPTTLDSAASAVSRMVAKNGDVKKSSDYFLALNNAILAGTNDIQKQNSALEQMQQAYAKGKMSMQDWKPILEAMPGQMKQVAQSMGMSLDELAFALGVDNPGSPTVSMEQLLQQITKLNKEGVGGFASFEEQARASTDGVGTSVEVMKSRITQGMEKVINAVGSENIKNALIGVGDAFKQIGTGIGDSIKNLKEWAKHSPAVQSFMEAVKVFIDIIKESLDKLMQSESFKLVLKVLGMLIGGALLAVIMALAEAIATVVWVVSTMFEMFDEGWKSIQELWKFFTEQFIPAFQEGIYNIAESVRKKIDDIKLWFGQLWEKIKSFFGGIGTWFKQKFQEAVNAIKGVFGGIGGFFGGIWNTIKQKFTSIGSSIGGAVGGAFKGAINGAISWAEGLVNGFIDSINGAISLINKIPGVNIGKLGRVSFARMASGGIVEARMGGTPVILGEGGQNEWVVPESKMADMIAKLSGNGFGGQIIQNNTINTPVDLQIINQRLGNAVRRAV